MKMTKYASEFEFFPRPNQKKMPNQSGLMMKTANFTPKKTFNVLRNEFYVQIVEV